VTGDKSDEGSMVSVSPAVLEIAAGSFNLGSSGPSGIFTSLDRFSSLDVGEMETSSTVFAIVGTSRDIAETRESSLVSAVAARDDGSAVLDIDAVTGVSLLDVLLCIILSMILLTMRVKINDVKTDTDKTSDC
jgi:hypothetical protein